MAMHGKAAYFTALLVAVVLTAAMALLFSSAEVESMTSQDKTLSAAIHVPPMDDRTPETIETATFSLG
jgi:hypothetical protein